jgi:hypothetical protein
MDFPYPTNADLSCAQLPGFNNTNFLAEPAKCSKIIGLDSAREQNAWVPLYAEYGDNSLLSYRGSSPTGTWWLWVYDDEYMDITSIRSFDLSVFFLNIGLDPSLFCTVQLCTIVPVFDFLQPTAEWHNGVALTFC